MLRELLYEMLMKLTKFVFGVEIMNGLFNMEGRLIGRILNRIALVGAKILSVCWWLAWYSFMISITGGLYLVWIAIKLAWKWSKRERKVKRKFRKRA